MEINTVRNNLQQFKDAFSGQRLAFTEIESNMKFFSFPNPADKTIQIRSEQTASEILKRKNSLDSFLAELQTNISKWLDNISLLCAAFLAQVINLTGGEISFSEVKDHIQSAIINFEFLKQNQCIQHLKTARQLATLHVQANCNSAEMPDLSQLSSFIELSHIDISQLENVKSILGQLTPQFFQKGMKPLVEACCIEIQDAMQFSSGTHQAERIKNCVDSLKPFVSEFRPRFQRWLEQISLLQAQNQKNALYHPDQEIDISELRHHVQSALGFLYFLQKKLPLFAAYLTDDQRLTMNQSVFQYTKLIYQKYSICFVLNPHSVMQIKTAASTSDNPRNNTNSSTKISMALQLLTVGKMSSQQNTRSIQFEIRLINNEAAQQCQSNEPDLNLQSNSIGSLINLNTTSTTPLPQISMSMDGEELGTTIDGGYISKTFSKRIEIAVTKVVRTPNVPVGNDKYFFEAVAQVQLPDFFNLLEPPYVVTVNAKAISSPLYLGTNTSQDIKLYQSASLNRFFREDTLSRSAALREKVSIAEIRGVLQQHFVEWTTDDQPSNTNKRNGDHVFGTLTITDSQLESLMNMLLQLVCNQMNIKTTAEIELLKAEIPLKYLYQTELLGGDKKFTFFSWYFKAVHLLRHHYFRKHWKAGHILGFINKQEAEGLLTKGGVSQIGMFLIRFSQSVEGEFAIEYVRFDGTIGSTRMKISEVGPGNIRIQNMFLKYLHTPTWTGITYVETYKIVYPGSSKSKEFPLPPGSEPKGSGYDGEKTFIMNDIDTSTISKLSTRSRICLLRWYLSAKKMLKNK